MYDCDENMVFCRDVCSSILEFSDQEYLFLGSANRRCRDHYRDTGTFTRVSSCFESVHRFTVSNIDCNIAEGSYDEYINRCGIIDVMKHTMEWKSSPNPALEHAIRGKNADVQEWFLDRRKRIVLSCMILSRRRMGRSGVKLSTQWRLFVHLTYFHEGKEGYLQ